MQGKIILTIEKYGLISPGDKVLVAVSGGADSVFLLWALKNLQKKYSLTLHIAHLNHGLRKKADREMEFVKSIARNYKIPITTGKIDIKAYARENKLTLEEAGREARYAFLNKIVSKIGATKIATGHTMTDEVETFFMRLARGTGRKGLSLIPPIRGNIIRPLIEIEHSDITRFLKNEKIKYETDYSNYNCKYTRNFVRHKIVKQLSSSFGKKIIQFREIMEQEEKLLEKLTEKSLNKLLIEKNNNDGMFQGIKLNLTAFLNEDVAIKRRVIRKLVEKLSSVIPNFEETENIIRYIAKAKPGNVFVSHNLQVTKSFSSMNFVNEKTSLHTIRPVSGGAVDKLSEPLTALRQVILPIPGEIKVGKYKICTKMKKYNFHGAKSGRNCKTLTFDDKHKEYFDFDKLNLPLCIRAKKIGDKFLGAGYSKSLKKVFIDDRIPAEKRMEIPLLIDKLGILWIIGGRRAYRALIEDNTKKILEVKVKAMNENE
ncbi:MAG: tRNA lysidine(34) synthetase TilS [bacterium]|nr:tRNA lysidine(34) synthetase TilS [bacterium]